MRALNKFHLFLLFYLFNALAITAQGERFPSLLSDFEYPVDIETKVKQGDSNAMWMLGLSLLPASKQPYIKGIINIRHFPVTTNEDEKLALKLINRSIKKGNPIAMIVMGRYESMPRYVKGRLKTDFHDKAAKWYKKAVKEGYGDAYALLYDIKSEEISLSKSPYHVKKEAFELLEQGIEMQSAFCAQKIAMQNYNEEPKDFKKAALYFSLMEEWGIYSVVLTEMYFEGAGVDRDYRKAIERMEKNMACPHLPTTYGFMADCFSKGTGVKSDLRKVNLLASFLVQTTSSNLLGEKFKSLISSTLMLHKYTENNDGEQQLLNLAKNYNYSTTYEDDEATVLSNGLYKLKIGGTYFIADREKRKLTHSLDAVYDYADSIVVQYGIYRTTIDNNGIMNKPIVHQMLTELYSKPHSIVEKMGLQNSILMLDADGEMLAASIVHNNNGAEIEKKAVPFNFEKATGKNAEIYNEHNRIFNEVWIERYYSEALPHYEKALELNPDFEIAEMNIERLKGQLKKKQYESPFMFALKSVIELTNEYAQSYNNSDIQTNSQVSEDEDALRKAKIGKKNKEIAKKHREEAKRNDVGYYTSSRWSNNTYHKYVDMLSTMTIYPEKYSNENRREYQAEMKKIRENNESLAKRKRVDRIKKSPWEDWNGDLRNHP